MRPSRIFISFLTLCFPLFVEGRIEGFRLVSGDANPPTAEGNGIWKMTSGQRAVVEWERFSLGTSEQFHFIQADGQSAILNRVVGSSLSEVFGQIHSNGMVILINPSGILIGKDARIETAGFIASTLDLSNDRFLAGKMDRFFGEGKGAVIHLGTISCPTGDVALISGQVLSEGSVSAPNGRVLLGTASGDWIQVESTPLDQLKEELNSGTSPYAKAICQKGIVSGGKIVVREDGGKIEIFGELLAPGGEVHVLGEEIAIKQEAKIDVSHKEGGGTILVGGDYQGKNPEIPNAKRVIVEKGVQIHADAIEKGNGGKIIFWGDDLAVFNGQITALGGMSGGNGGFAEISSPHFLDISGILPDLRAPLGKYGKLLFDPPDVTISNAATTGGTFTTTCTGAPPCSGGTFTPGATNPININNTDLQNCLICADVTIATSAGSGGGSGNITVSNTVSAIASATQLILTAEGTLAVNASITANDLIFTADGNLTVGASLNGNNSISLTSNGTAGANYDGVNINANLNAPTIILSGRGNGTTRVGVKVAATVTGDTSVTFTNCFGGTAGAANYGVDIQSGRTVTGATITASGIHGGASSGNNNYGMNIAGIISNASLISLTADSNGSGGSNNAGIVVSGSITIASGAMTLTGTGCTSASGGGHYGVWLVSGGQIATNGGTITLTGTGGTNGASGTNHGVFHEGTINGVSGTGLILIQNAIAGSSAGTASVGYLCTGDIIGNPTNPTNPFQITGCTGGTGSTTSGSYGVRLANSISCASFTSSNNTGGTSTGGNNVGMFIDGGAVEVVGNATFTGTGGSGGTGASNHGVLVDNSAIIRSNTTITFTGVAGTGTGGAGHAGVFLDSGSFTNFGFPPSGDAPTVAFLNCQGSSSNVPSPAVYLGFSFSTTSSMTFTSCTGGTGASNANYGVVVQPSVVIFSPTITGTSIQGGSTNGGNDNVGFYVNGGTVGSTSSLSTINITATSVTSLAGSGTGNVGIQVGTTGAGGGLVASGGSGTVTLTGTGATANGGAGGGNHGIWITNTGSKVQSGSGTITLSGSASGGAGASASIGLLMDGSTNNITSTTGAINVSGASTASVTGSHGVSWTTAWAAGTSNLITLNNCTGSNTGASHGVNIGSSFTGSGAVTFSNCTGGTGGSNGINVGGAFTTAGVVTATTGITGQGSGGVGFLASQNFQTSGASSTLSVTATATGATGACHGISLTGGSLSTSGASATITLIGTGGTSTTASHGISITGGDSTVLTNAANIVLQGTASGSTAPSFGVNLNGSAVGFVRSTSGGITVSGASTNSAAGSHGVSIQAAWTTSTSGLVTFSNCTGSNGGASHGVNVAAAFSTTGSVTATSGIVGGSGAGSIGFNMGAAFGSTGAGTIAITATTNGTSAGAHGIALASGALSTTGAGVVTLIGSSNAGSTGTCNGVNFSGGTISGSSGAINVTGTVLAGATGTSLGINMASVNGAASTSGPITFSGTSNATGANSHGIAVAAAWAANTSNSLSLTGVHVNAGSFDTAFSNSITTNGGSVTVLGSSGLLAAISIDTTNGGGTPAGGAITFSGSTSTVDGAQNLTLDAGAQLLTFGANVGSSAALTALSLDAGSYSVAANITTTGAAGSISFNAPVTITGNSIMTTDSSADILFNASATINGAFNLTLNASATGDASMAAAVTVGALTVTTPGGNITQTPSVTTSTGGISYTGNLVNLTNNTSFSTLSVTGSTITINSTHVAAGAMLYTGPVVLGDDTFFINTGSGGITFTETITGNHQLQLNAASTFISVAGNVSTAGTAVGASGQEITANAGGDITFSGSISSQGGLATGAAGPSGADILIQSTGGSVFLQAVNSSGTNDALVGGAAGGITLQAGAGTTSGALGNIPDGILVLAGALTANGGTGAVAGLGGDIELSPAGRTDYPSIATITSSFSGNSITIDGGTLTMGTNEAMTAFGDITVTLTADGTVSDMVARDALTITSPGGLTLVGHGSVSILNSAGDLVLITGGHLLARTAISANVTTTVGAFSGVGLVPDVTQLSFQALLTYEPNSYMLNFDTETQPVPSPTPSSSSTIPSRASLIEEAAVASISYQNLLPMLGGWGIWSYPYRGEICPLDPEDPCWPIPDIFDVFNLDNQVVENEESSSQFK